MGVAQNAVNSALGSIQMAAGLSKLGKHIDKEEAAREAEALKTQKTMTSYENEMKKRMGDALEKYPNLKEPAMFQKAMDYMNGQLYMMGVQRDITRTYRNQYAPGSEEYNRIETAGQARKQSNLEGFSEGLKNMAEEAKPKSPIITPDSSDWNGGK